MKNIIRYVNLKCLKKKEQDDLKRVLEFEYEKVHRLFNNFTDLVVHITTYKSTKGSKTKYSIHMKAEAPTVFFSVEQADWDLTRTARKTITNLKNAISKRLKSEPNTKRTFPTKHFGKPLKRIFGKW